MRAAYLIHQEHEDKAKNKGHTNVGVQPGMVVAMLVHRWDFRYLLRLHHVLHLARWVMLSCDSKQTDQETKHDTGTSFLLCQKPSFLDNTQKSLVMVFF